jgi:hypothetical protein
MEEEEGGWNAWWRICMEAKVLQTRPKKLESARASVQIMSLVLLSFLCSKYIT